MKVEYDSRAKALYVDILGDGYEHSHSEELVADKVVIDRTKDGRISGIEFLGIEEFVDIT